MPIYITTYTQTSDHLLRDKSSNSQRDAAKFKESCIANKNNEYWVNELWECQMFLKRCSWLPWEQSSIFNAENQQEARLYLGQTDLSQLESLLVKDYQWSH